MKAEAKLQKWFSQTALAKRYGVTTRTVQRWRKTGKLPPATTLPSGRPAWGDIVIEAHERGLVGNGEAA
jgi:hypothetical protein